MYVISVYGLIIQALLGQSWLNLHSVASSITFAVFYWS